MDENKKLEDWRLIESDDCIQTDHYTGGFDSIEDAFCFSYYDEHNDEYWFQISLEDVEKIVIGEILNIELRRPD